MKKIQLNQGKYTLVDNEDYKYLNQWKWHITTYSKTSTYVVRTLPRQLGKKTILMHRLIMKPAKNKLIDHIDNNGLNNQRSNLRIATRKQNAQNRDGKINSKLPYKGIEQRNSGNWRARIGVNNKLIYLGNFSNAKLAAQAYNQAAKKYFGKYAKLNIINQLN